MTPQTFTPDRATYLMSVANKYEDQELLDAVLELVAGSSGLQDKERQDPRHVALRDDAVRAALDYGYRQTTDCERHCEEYLGIAV